MGSLKVKSVLITGANRGIGLEFVKQMLSLDTPPQHVFATYRDESSSGDLLKLAQEHKNLELLNFEVTDYNNMGNLVKTIQEKLGNDGLTLLINNAGVMDVTSKVQDMEADNMVKSYHINTVGPLMLIKHLLPLLKQAAVKNTGENKFTANRSAIIYISTKVASLKDNTSGGLYSYRCSKVASNMFMKNLSIELKGDGILCFTLHPGWVQTSLGTSRAPTLPAESVEGMMKVIRGATESENAAFIDFKGNNIPW